MGEKQHLPGRDTGDGVRAVRQHCSVLWTDLTSPALDFCEGRMTLSLSQSFAGRSREMQIIWLI